MTTDHPAREDAAPVFWQTDTGSMLVIRVPPSDSQAMERMQRHLRDRFRRRCDLVTQRWTGCGHVHVGQHSSKEVDMALSDQLAELATRAKEAEDRATAARDKSKADLEADVEPRERLLKTGLRSCASRLTRTRTSSQSGGTTYSARGTSTSRRFATTSRASELSTTWIEPSGAPSIERTTRRSPSTSRTRQSRRRSTQSSTLNWRGWRRTSCRRPDHRLSGARGSSSSPACHSV